MLDGRLQTARIAADAARHGHAGRAVIVTAGALNTPKVNNQSIAAIGAAVVPVPPGNFALHWTLVCPFLRRRRFALDANDGGNSPVRCLLSSISVVRAVHLEAIATLDRFIRSI